MEYAVCLQSMVAQRLNPSEKSEMVNQLLFGDLVKVLSTDKSWVLVENQHDNYQAWTNILQLQEISYEDYIAFSQSSKYYSSSLFKRSEDESGNSVAYSFGSWLHGYQSGIFTVSGMKFKHETEILEPSHNLSIKELAMEYVGSPYLWGGRSIFGIDCSGFVQMVFKLYGVSLPRDASQQVEKGELVNFIDEAKEGDIAFFENEEGSIIHTGIILNDKKIIHASGEVKINEIDHNGIFDKNLDKYTHKLRVIKRVS